MSPEEQLSEKIDNYLNGMLSKEETASFEEDIKNNPEWKAELEQRRLAMSAVDDLIAFDLRAQMNQWKEEKETVPPIQSNRSSTTNNIFWWLLIGVLGALGLYFLSRTNKTASDHSPRSSETEQIDAFPVDTNSSTIPPSLETQTPSTQPVNIESNEEKPVAEESSKPNTQSSDLGYLALVDKRYKPLENEPNLKSPSSAIDSTLQFGIQTFKKGNYAKAILIFATIADTDSKAKEYLAHSYFKDGKHQQAITILESILEAEPGQNLKERIQWYLLLSYVAEYTKHKSKVEALLQAMLKPENYHSYRKDAAQLKLDLDNISSR